LHKTHNHARSTDLGVNHTTCARFTSALNPNDRCSSSEAHEMVTQNTKCRIFFCVNQSTIKWMSTCYVLARSASSFQVICAMYTYLRLCGRSKGAFGKLNPSEHGPRSLCNQRKPVSTKLAWNQESNCASHASEQKKSQNYT
jgi:hypothetical protein